MVSIPAGTVAAWKRATSAGGGGYTTTLEATILDAYGTPLSRTVKVIDAQWEWDGTSTKPLSGSLTVPAIDFSDMLEPVDWRPSHVRSPLTPFGNRVRMRAGVDNSIDTATVDLGMGLIKSVEYSRPAEVLTVAVTDLADELDQAQLTVDFSILAAGTTLSVVVESMLIAASLPRDPAVVDVLGLLPRQVPPERTWNPGTSVWEVIQDAVQAVDPDARAWFDRDGTLRIDVLTVDVTRPPNVVLTSRPEYTLRTGPGGHITELQSELTREGAVNLVAVAVEDSEIVEPELPDPDDTSTPENRESDRAGERRNRAEAVAGKASGMAKKVTTPSARRGGWTDKAPTPPRWPFMDAAAHPAGAGFGATGAWKYYHTGVDFQSPGGGAQVVAVCQGRIVAVGGSEAGWAGPHYVVQQASDGDRFYYAHLNSADCKVGDFLLRGDPIGKSGWQGNVRPPGPAGAHLHLERRQKPYNWPDSTIHWRQGDVK